MLVSVRPLNQGELDTYNFINLTRGLQNNLLNHILYFSGSFASFSLSILLFELFNAVVYSWHKYAFTEQPQLKMINFQVEKVVILYS